ncbi:hypothetical protein [Campylobacter sp. VBCF_01 NA2]|uniref:hypothetical protein n=2 Tax=Campylobacter TaxID=194 RepID=UPI0022E9CF3F|nr:hypothetical protein [Campylobacter sp. VBCF_01 NA2]WBR54058.1 hypothetical protein PF027_06980 [Campylobacter sp. VBCF_01 NA2]
MKALNKSRGSIVLATILFAVGGVGIADAVGIDGATPSGNNPNYIGVKSPSGAKVTISESGSDTVSTKTVVFGGYTNGTDNVLNNSVKVDNTTLSIASIQAGYSTLVGDGTETTTRQVNSNSIYITGSILSASMWAGRADKSYAGEAKYNTTVIDKSSEINHNQLRGAIVYSSNGKAEYNTLSVKDSTMYAHGNSFEITGAMGQADDTTKPVTVSFNQLIYEGVTTYAHPNKGATSKYLFGGATRVGEVKDNRVYVKNLNKDVGNSVAIETNVVGGATYRPNSGGATGNIAVATGGESKIANIYGGAVGLAPSVGALGEKDSNGNDVYENGKQKLKLDSQGNYILPITGKTDGANNNLAILDLSDAGIVNKNVYGGYVSDKYDVTRKLEGTNNVEVIDTISYDATTKDNAVYFMSGTVAGSVIGGSKEATGNTLILGKDKYNLGKVKAGQISNFNTLQFNAFTHGDKATLTLTNPQIGADLESVAINVLKEDASGAVKVKVGGNNNREVSIEERGGGGGENAITNLTKNAIKYGTNLDKIAIITGGAQANNNIEETLTRSRTDEEYQAKYGIGDTFSYTYDVIDLNKEKNKKFYLIKSATSLQNIIPDPNNNINGIDINWQNKEHSGETLANGAKIVDAFQPDQIYKILSSKEYTRNLRGIYLENNDENLYFTGTDEITEEWSDPKFNTNEFAKFNQPSNTGNHVYVETNIQTGDLGGKTIYGGYSDSDDSTKNSVENNNIYINQNANLSNATIIGGFSQKGKVSGNSIDLNKTNITADIILAQTESGSVEVSSDDIKNADKVTIGGSVTIAKSTGSANLNGLNFEMPKFEKITGDFTLADTNTGSANENSLTLNNDINVDGNIYTAKSLGNANKNTLTLNGNVKANEIYVAKGANEATDNKLIINGEIDSTKVVVAEGKTTNKNIADFNSGKITGTLYGGIGSGKENTLNVNSTKLEAGNVANFNIMNFKDITSTKNNSDNAALILTKDEATDLSGVRIDISNSPYKVENYATLDKDSKYYLIHKNNNKLANYDKIENKPMPNQGNTVGNGDKAVGALQTDQVYKILDKDTYTRNLAGMFVSENKQDLYITGAKEFKETWENDKFDTDEFAKFDKPDNKDNHIFIEANAGDLGGKTIYGGYSDSEDVNNNNIYINQGANLSNATIIGGYSISGKVSNNTVDLNNTSVIADITLAQTDSGSIDIATTKLINANNQKITGSLTVAKSDSANLEKATYIMPENITITGDFILANSDSGNISNNTLDVTNAIAKNIYVGKTNSGEVSNNTINIKGDKVDGNIYVGYSQSKATNNNIANFEKGEVTGTIYGGNNGTGNTLNVKDTKLKAGNVANFQVINFDNSNNKLASTKNNSANAALIITKNEATDLSGVRIDISDNQYNIENNPGYATLDKNSKYYLIRNENSTLTNYDQITNTPMPMPNQGNTVGNGDIAVGALQTDQIYKIKSSALYTRNLAGMFVSKDEKDLYITGASEVEENWDNAEFNTDEFTKFGKPDNKDNHIYIEANAGDLGGKTIYGGYSDNDDVSSNNIYLNQNASLSNTTIIGGYSKSGTVSNNTVDLNNTSVIADITLAQTDSGSIDIATTKLINANNQKITGSLTVAKSDSANLEKATYIMPENITITGDFILANSDSGNISNNTLDVTNAIAKNIYVGKTNSGEVSNNTINIKGDKVDGNIYVGYSQSKATNNNIANFEKGEVTGTIYGGNNGTGNTLNVKDTKLKAGNVANFQVMNFTGDITKTTSADNAALKLTADDNTDLSKVEIQINDTTYNPENSYGLSANQKAYLIAHTSSADSAENVNFNDLKNYAYGKETKTIKDGSTAINVIQTNNEYRIIDSQTYTRNLQGMFADSDKNHIYITAENEVEEKLDKTLGDEEFTKFGGDIIDNTITIDPKDPSKPLDLSNVTIGGSDPSGNTLNIGKDSSNTIEMDKITVKDVQNFEKINFYLPKNPGVGTTAVKLSDGSSTDLSNSNVMIYVDNLDDLEKQGGRVHLFDGNNELANNKPKSANYQIGSILMIDVTNSLDLSVDKTTPITPTDQTKIFNEARIAGMAAVWEGSYLISNHLERIIPDGYTELFPYAIVEGYDKRYNTGSHVDSLGFNANAGLAGKAPNSKGEFTMGIFIEYGNVDYDAYLDDGTKGSGDAYYAGVGAFGKQENTTGSYYEGSFRVGQLTTNFDGTLNFNGVSKYYDWSIDSTYYAVHVGGGKIVPLSDSNDLDFYARYFYTHIDAADIKIDGVDTHFDALQSHKIRAGLQDNFKIDEHNKFFVGLAGEYEFSSEAGGRFIVPNGSTGEMLSPDLKGLTGIGEIGYQYKTETLKFDAGVKGYAGKQEGVSAQMALSIAF